MRQGVPVAHGLERLAEIVRLYREGRLLSQDALARNARPKTNRSAVAHLEQALRMPSPAVLRGICTYLGIPEAVWLPFESGTAAEQLPASPSIVSVAGLMGSGKTTLARRLASALGLTYISESSLGVQFLGDLATNRARWAFDTQLAFLSQKALAIQSALDRGARILVDRSLREDIEIFARHFFEMGDIDKRSFEVYMALASHFLRILPEADILVYCRCRPATALARIAARERTDVRLHTPDHVSAMAARYEGWIGTYTSSTAVAIDSDVHDLRDPRVVQTVAAELERIYAETPVDLPQLDLFSSAARAEGGSARSGLLTVLFRGPRPLPIRSFSAAIPLPYPSAYVAAPFTGRARPSTRGARTLFPVGQPEGRIERGPYRSALLSIVRELEDYGIRAVLPHRDLNLWGRKSLSPEEVIRACTTHVLSTDVFVGLLGTSHGAHYEFGVARGMGKPCLILRCKEIGESFIGSGIESAADTLVLRCARLKEVGALVASEEADAFLRRHIIGMR